MVGGAFTRGCSEQVEGALSIDVYSRGRRTSFAFALLGAPIVEHRIAEALEAVSPGVLECLPIRVHGTQVPYVVLNILREIDCIDRERSELKWYAGSPGSDDRKFTVTTLVIDPTRVPTNEHIFYVKHMVNGLVVDDVLVEALRLAGATGLSFIPVATSEARPTASPLDLPAAADAPTVGALLPEQRGLAALQEALRAGVGVSEGMKALLATCNGLTPSPLWEAVAKQPFESDVRGLRDWFAELLVREPPDANIRSLWFGIFQEEGWLGVQRYRLYAAGSMREASEDTVQWAVGPEWSPKRRYASSRILARLPRLTRRDDGQAAALADYLLPLAYSWLAVADVCRCVSLRDLNGPHARRAIGVGYDSGDFVLLT